MTPIDTVNYLGLKCSLAFIEMSSFWLLTNNSPLSEQLERLKRAKYFLGVANKTQFLLRVSDWRGCRPFWKHSTVPSGDFTRETNDAPFTPLPFLSPLFPPPQHHQLHSPMPFVNDGASHALADTSALLHLAAPWDSRSLLKRIVFSFGPLLGRTVFIECRSLSSTREEFSSGESNSLRERVILFGRESLSSGESRSLRESVALFGRESLSSGESRSLRERVALFGRESLSSGESRSL